MVLITGSVYTTVILSLDRCLAVVKPLHWASTFTRRRIKVALLLVFIFAVVVDSPVFFQAELRMAYYPRFNDSFLSGRPTEYYFSWFHQEVYMRNIMPVFQIIIPLILIVSSNSAIVAKVVLHKRKSSGLRGHGRTPSRRVPPLKPETAVTAAEIAPPPPQSVAEPKQCRHEECTLNPLLLQNSISNDNKNNSSHGIGHKERPGRESIDRSTNSSNTQQTTSVTKLCTNIYPGSRSDYDLTNRNTDTNTPTAASGNISKGSCRPATARSSRSRGRSQGVDVSKLTAQVVAISLITLTSRALAAANFYIVTEEEIFYIKYCSRACAWTGAFNILFIKINSSVNFVFYCFFGGKFRTVFKSTFGCFWCRDGKTKSNKKEVFTKPT